MTRPNVRELLADWPVDALAQIVETLARRGIVTDEDGTGLSSTMIEAWEEDCDVVLRELGYQGAPLRRTGKFFSFAGAIYALYDPSRVEYEQAIDYLDRVAKRNRQEHSATEL